MNKKLERSGNHLADFTRDKRILMLALIAVGVGMVSAITAYVLLQLITLFTNIAFYQQLSLISQSPTKHHLGYFVIVVPIIGGTIIGLMARFGSEKIRGHGIPEAIEAILFRKSRMSLKVAILKPISSAISIGTGGPFGAEGPIIMTGGAIGSLFAQLFHLSAAERKTLLVAGAAGGMSAIFASPVAAVLLAVELLLFEWRPRSLIPVAFASASAFALRIPLLGADPIFPVAIPGVLHGQEFIFAFLVGIAAGLGSGILSKMVYAFEDLFAKLPIHWMWWPAIGGLFIGIGGLIEPHILGVGYDTIHELLLGHILGIALISILITKAIVWALALGSGTSGGVLAPLLMVGAALGALEGSFIPVGSVPLWAVISMAAVMGGSMRAPLTAIIFAIELTQNINLLPGLLVGCITAYAVTVFILRRSILTEKLARRGHHLTSEYGVDPLTSVRVSEVMDTHFVTIPATTKMMTLANRIAQHDPQVANQQAFLIVDDTQQLVGVVTRNDILQSLEQGIIDNNASILEVGSQKLVVSYPDELVYEAMSKMLHNDIGRLPVVSRENNQQLVGYLERANLMVARVRQLDAEHVRERGLNVQ